MSDTAPDTQVSKETYVNINSLTGFPVGTGLVITNKSTSRVRLQISISQPAALSTDGEILFPGPDSTSVKFITAGENTIWAKSLDSVDAILSVQDGV